MSLTPFRPIELLVLTVLAAGDRHGYGIRQEILDSTQGQVELQRLRDLVRYAERTGILAPARA